MNLPPIPTLTPAQMQMVDQAMVDMYAVPIAQIMEVVGLRLASLMRSRLLNGDATAKRVIVLAGTGGNGGDGLAAARWLHCWGANVSVVLSKEPAAFRDLAAQQLNSVQRLGITISGADALPLLAPADSVLDGLIGSSLNGPPRDSVAALIRWVNTQPAPVLAIDNPSGLDCNSGIVYEPTVRATITLTLALPKTGLLTAAAVPYLGELYLADIGVPPQLYQRLFGLDIGPLFAQQEIVRLTMHGA
jgi:NAD(P)H-hydrate epimerase